MELPYQQHLAFTQEDRYSISSTFNIEFLLGEIKSEKLRPLSDLKKIADEAVIATHKIFDELDNQTNVERERLFLKDLRKHTIRILNEDNAVCLKRNNQSTSLVTSFPKRYVERCRVFRKQRYLHDKISKEATGQINELISGMISHFRTNVAKGLTTRDDLSINESKINLEVIRILNSEFKKNGILSVIKNYMGYEFHVTGVAIELSVPTANWWNVSYNVYERNPKTQYFHFDESIGHPKAIVYLTDVGEKNGATSCVPTFFESSGLSHLHFLIGRSITCVGKQDNPALNAYYKHIYHQIFGCPVFREDFSRLPQQMAFSSHFGFEVIPNSTLESYLIENEKKIIGGAGTFIAFDGAKLLHRGGMVSEGERVALQVVFGEKFSLLRKIKRKIKKLIL